MTNSTHQTTIKQTPSENLETLLQNKELTKIPQVGDLVKGKIINLTKNEVHLDIGGLTTGVVRGRELYDESGEYSNLKIGEEVEATVLELENENGEIELSFRYAGHQKAWDHLKELQEEAKIVDAKITEANKGGLIVKVGNVIGFLPVSQLSPEHYPRVQGGDKNKILEKLRKFIGQTLKAKVITVDEAKEKLIISEKAAWEEEQKDVITGLKTGNVIEGIVTAVTDFGAFVKFNGNLEGLVHISEIAWQRIDDPRAFLDPGQKIKAQVIKIDGSKIFLSMKSLIADPWSIVYDKYNVGDIVEGKVLKVNPFGLFVELDVDIHGLAHISELSSKPVVDPFEIAKAGDMVKFRVLTIEPHKHRLGLSIKAIKDYKKPEDKVEGEEKKEDKKEDKKEEVKAEVKVEVKAEVKEEKPVEAKVEDKE